MSRTTHTTPSFPRALRGPRGGRHTAPTPCVECVSFTSCRPGTCSAPYGCESWVDEDGRRVDVLADLDPQPVDLDALDAPDPLDPNPYQPSPATLSEMSGIFPTDDPEPERCPACHRRMIYCECPPSDSAPEPDGGRFTFETMGGLVKGRCGLPSVESAYAIMTAATRLKHELAAMKKATPDRTTETTDDPGPLFGGRKFN